MSAADDTPQFQQVAWDEITRTTRWLTVPRAVFLIGFLLVATGFVYDRYVSSGYLIFGLMPEPIDWVFLLGVVVLIAFGLIPAIQHRRSTVRYLRRLLRQPLGLVGTVLFGAFLTLGLIASIFWPRPLLNFGQEYLPPVGFTSEVVANECPGGVTGEAFERVCHGSWEVPLGTDARGLPMEYLVAEGASVALYVVVIMAAFVIPIAVVTGVVAGLRGGLVDDLLMAYVDIQLSIPAILIYFIGYIYWNPSLLLLLATFGLLSWGGIARLVRSEVLQRREDGHVMVAKSVGASQSYIAKRHILPNVTNTVIPAAFHLLALLVLVEAGVAFLGFHDIQVYSWGSIISESINANIPPQLVNRAEVPAHTIWWVSTLPAVALTLTMVSLKLVGDGLRDALDPRSDV